MDLDIIKPEHEKSLDERYSFAINRDKKAEIQKPLNDQYSYVQAHEDIMVKQNEEQMQKLVDLADDPEKEREKILSSTFLAQQLGVDSQHVYQNHDIYVQRYLDRKEVPTHSFTAIKNEWDRGWLNNQVSDLGIKLMADPNNEELIKELDELYAKMPEPDKQERGLVTDFAKSTTAFVPSMASAGAWGLGGGAVGGIVGYFAGGGAGAAKGAEIGAKVGTLIGGAKNATGSIFTSIMSTTDPETGQMLLKDPVAREAMYKVAVATSISGGVVSGLVEKAQIGTFLGGSITQDIFENVTNQGLKNFLSKRVLQHKARQVVVDYGLEVGEEVLQEIAQESTELLAEELSKAVYNYHESSNLPQATRDEWLSMIKETAVTTAQGTAVLGVGKRASLNAKKLLSKEKKAGFAKSKEAVDVSIENIVSFDSTEESRIIAGEQLDKKKASAIKGYKNSRGDVVVTDGNATVDKAIEKKLGTVPVELGDLEQRANSIDELYEDAENNREEFKRVVSSLGDGHVKSLKPRNQVTNYKTETGILRAEIIGDVDNIIESVDFVEIEDVNYGSKLIINVGNHLGEIIVRTPEQKIKSDQDKLSSINEKAQEYGYSIEELSDIKEVENSLEGGQRKEFHKIVRENEVKELKKIKVSPRKEPDTMPIWTKTQSQLLSENQKQSRKVDEKRNSINLSILRERINETYKDKDWGKSATEGVTALVNARAKVMNMSPDEWVDTYLSPETLQELESGNYNGYTKFLEDGKAIIKVTEISDISTLFHELGHVIRKQLSPQELDTVKESLNISEFDRKGEEKFAEAFEQYLQTGVKFSKELSSIFNKIKDFLKSVYSSLIHSDLNNENLQKVFNMLFTEPSLESDLVDNKAGELVLFQKANPETKEFKEWFGASQVVDKDGSPKVMYHGTTKDFFSFNTDVIFVTENPELATIYSQTHKGKGSQIIPVFVRAENVFNTTRSDHREIFEREFYRKWGNGAELSNNGYPDWTDAEDFKEFFEDNGFEFDGVFVQEPQGDISLAVFSPNQVKSIHNKGDYSNDNPNMLYQRSKKYLDPEAVEKHRTAIQEAIKNYYPVTREVVEDYKGEQWADDYLELFDFLSDFPEIVEQARYSSDYDQFIEKSGVSEQERVSKSWMLDQVFNRAQVKSIGEGNQHFKDLIADDEVLDQMLSDMHKDYYKIKDYNLNHTIKKASKSARYGTITPELRDKARKIITGDSIVKYRKIFSTIGGMQDLDELRAIDIQETYQKVDRKPLAYEDLTPYKRGQFIASFDNYKDQKKYLEGGFYGKELQGLLETVNKNIKSLNEEIEDINTKTRTEIDKLNSRLWIQEKEINSLTKKSEAEKEQMINEFKQKISEEKKKATENKNEALKSLRKEIRGKEAQKRAIRNERKRGLQLAKAITKAPTAYIAFEYQERVRAVQEALNIDPKYRSKATIDNMLENLGKIDYEGFLHTPGAVGNKYIQRLKNNIKEGHSTPLNFFTIAELEDLYNYIKGLKREGRLKKERDDDIRKQKLRQSSNKIKSEMLGGKDFTGIRHLGSKESEKKTRSSIFTKERINTLTPSRVFQFLAKGVKGELYKVFHDDLNVALNESLDNRFKREAKGDNELKKLGIKKKDLSKSYTLEFDGEKATYTIDEIIHMNIALKNEQSRDALIYGNFIGTDRYTESELEGLEEKALNQINQFISKLDDKYIKWGDYLLKDFDDNYNRLREAYILDKNEDLGHVENYFTIVRAERRGDDGKSLHDILKEESKTRTKYANKDMTKSRVEIANHHQTPIKLGATAIWTNQVEKQEHYISHFQILKDMNYITENIKDVAKVTYGNSATKWLGKFVEDVSKPDLFKNHDDITTFQTLLRNNMAVSYLAFNLMTIAKQMPSFLYYSYNTNPVDMMASAVDFISHPVKTMEFVDSNSPQMKSRAINRFTEEMKQDDSRKSVQAVKKVGQVGMLGITYVDKGVTALGWNAIYKTHYKKLSQIMSHEKAHKEACKEADTTIMNTQPSARAKDLPALYRSESAVKWFLMFSNQLNKIYNITTYDIPQSFKNMQFGKGMSQTIGVLMGMSAMSFLGGFKLPEDEEEKSEAITKEFLKQISAYIPVVGKGMSQGIDGFYGNSGVDMLPVSKEIGEIISMATDGSITDEEAFKKATKGLAAQGSVAFGLPYTSANRTYKAITEKEVLELLGSSFTKGDKD